MTAHKDEIVPLVPCDFETERDDSIWDSKSVKLCPNYNSTNFVL